MKQVVVYPAMKLEQSKFLIAFITFKSCRIFGGLESLIFKEIQRLNILLKKTEYKKEKVNYQRDKMHSRYFK